ncbi:UNKNOWN [Stylonychia lemnae]|uniref:Uncharacterized protein n=1 Tax=Stylonychia lemnae TaxID=5949 RepID=A0A078AL40_STYLE|nr:UNKNOWN [Stylonychia lemnae]|eukprot:CDW81578.1 UNKNOWN [Stylonychia lemnae]
MVTETLILQQTSEFSRDLSLYSKQITSIQQIGNNENDFDENVNPDLVHYYENSNSQIPNMEAFIGNIVAFQRCSYVFNFAYNPVSKIKTYQIQRYTVSIEYDKELKSKRTIFNKKSEYTFQRAKNGYNDFPCTTTEFYYHPGIKGIIYLMDDNLTISVMQDASFPKNGDPCEYDLFNNSQQINQFNFSIKDFDLFHQGLLRNFIFLNETLYIVTHGQISDKQSLGLQSKIWRVDLFPQSPKKFLHHLVQNTSANEIITQIASLETIGFIYTKKDVRGYTLSALNKSDNFNSSNKPIEIAKTDYWKIYQSRADNHMHRPIFGVNSSYPSAISRLTSIPAQVFNDITNNTDFYNFTVQFARFHALVLNPGLCGQTRNTTDYNNIRAFVVNLRRMELEKCLNYTLVGCGDGVYRSKNEGDCDDGNLIDGDGCSSNCKIETFYNCTQVEGKKSVCSQILCGNGKKDFGEECDDQNERDGDGCNSTCKEEIGWSCDNLSSCKKMCMDGKVYQQNKMHANGSIYEYYREECDQVEGCNNETCKAVLGWNCTQNMEDQTSKCTQICGNLHNDLGEVCDDGNNVGGDGCAQGCKQIEQSYSCPLVGKCSSSCGNHKFEGIDHSIEYEKILEGEECDDGNNLNGDGCSSACVIEEGYTCVNIVWKLVYEIPIYYSSCKKSTGGNGETNGTKAYYKYIQTETEFIFDDNSVNIRQLSGKFRLIETGDSQNVYGINYASNKYGYNFLSYLKSGEQPVEYIKIQLLKNGTASYYEEINYPYSHQYQFSLSNTYTGYQRGTFGKYLVKNDNQTSLGFYALVKNNQTGDISFDKIYNTLNLEYNQYLGSHEVWYWPYANATIARYIDGINWKGHGFSKNILQMLKNPEMYPDNERIEGRFQRQMTMSGQIQLPIIFYKWFIIVYVSTSTSSGALRVYKYFDDIDYLVPYNNELVFTSTNNQYRQYSLVFFNKDFGIIFKRASSNVLIRYLVSSMTTTSSPTFDDRGLILQGYQLSELIMIQRRQDPDNPEEERDVYGYFPQISEIYRITSNVQKGNGALEVVEKIIIPALGLELQNGFIDVGKYFIVVYSAVQCGAQIGQVINSSSAYFYRFSTKEWLCMNLNNPAGLTQVFAWQTTVESPNNTIL